MDVGTTFCVRVTVCGEAGVESSKVTESRFLKRLSPPARDQLFVTATSQLPLMLPTQVLLAPEPERVRTKVSSPGVTLLFWKARLAVTRVAPPPPPKLSVGVVAWVRVSAVTRV